MRSPLYWHRLIYENVYGRSHPNFEGRFEVISRRIPPGAEVLDLCCGEARFFTHYLSRQNCRYTGIDISLKMAPHRVRTQLIKGNIRSLDLPVADYVVMIESVYHFYPDTAELLQRMRRAARKQVIIIEQIKNKITRMPNWLCRLISNPGDGGGWYRFDRAHLEKVIFQVDRAARREPLFGDYDLWEVLEGKA